MSFIDFMSGWGWVIFSVISTIFSATIYLINQYLKQPGHLLVFWSRFLTVIVLTPVMQKIAWPVDPRFYTAVALTALFGAFADIRTFNVAAKYGGGVVARAQPLIILLTFLLWFFFDHGQITRYLDHPFRATLTLLSLGGCAYFSSRLGKCHISRNAFFEMLPALLGYTLTTLLNKYAMAHGPLTGVVFCYMYVQSAIAVPLTGAYAIWHEKTKTHLWHRRHMLIAAIATMFCWICSMVVKNYAMVFIPNPSYMAAINQMTPVLIALFYWKIRHKEEADVASGMGVVFFTTLLVLVTGG